MFLYAIKVTANRKLSNATHVILQIFKGTLLALLFVYGTRVYADQNYAGQRSVKAKSSSPSLDVVLKIESNLTLPKGAHSLSSYVRYYALKKIARQSYIVAVFVRRTDENGRIEIVKSKYLPIIFDGGCDVVEMRYSLSKKKVTSLFCHGDA